MIPIPITHYILIRSHYESTAKQAKQEQQLTLISHKLFPYVQRAAITLKESNNDYKRIDIDLNNKSDWFQKISPTGKVSLLVIDDETVLFESAVIAEYINDNQPMQTIHCCHQSP